MTTQEREKLIATYFEAVAAADADRLREIVTTDLRWVVPRGAVEPYAGVHEGAEAILEMMLASVGAAFVPGSQHATIRGFVHGEGPTAAEVQIRADAPDGRRYENYYAFFFAFRDERISEIREYVDTRTAAAFFGV